MECRCRSRVKTLIMIVKLLLLICITQNLKLSTDLDLDKVGVNRNQNCISGPSKHNRTIANLFIGSSLTLPKQILLRRQLKNPIVFSKFISFKPVK